MKKINKLVGTYVIGSVNALNFQSYECTHSAINRSDSNKNDTFQSDFIMVSNIILYITLY